MTATLHALGTGREAGSYYTSDPRREARPHRRDEYYVGVGEAGDPPSSRSDPARVGIGAGDGIWWSSGGTIVTHGAPVDAEVFRDLCAGLDPRTGDGPQTAVGLVRGAGASHRAGWDMTLSAPKSVSLLWAAGDEAQREVIRGAHRQAVAAALGFLEREGLVEVRLGAGGAQRERSTDLIVARFDHFTSREGDPNIHSHCVLMNVAGSSDGKFRTLEPRALYAWQKVVGSAYRMALSEQLHAHGLRARQAGRGQFEIAGVHQALIERFSKRSAQIEAVVGDRQDATGRQKEIANLATRQGKELVPTGDALEARWLEEFGADREMVWDHALAAERDHLRQQRVDHSDELGISLDSTVEQKTGHIVADFPSPPEVPGPGPAAQAASALFRHEIVLQRRALLERAFAAASLSGLGEDAVLAEIEALETSAGLMRLTPPGGREAAWTTPELARQEAEMLQAARRSDERTWITPAAIETALDDAPHLSEEQMRAVRDAGSRDGVCLLQAGAGTGKTTTARPIVQAAELSGLRVIGLTPSWVAADELRKSTGIPAVAIAKWRYDRNRGNALPLDDRTVLLVDEASMVATRDMAEILIAARDAGAKVLLVGDQRQLEAVGAGGPLRIVADCLEKETTLLQVRRQQVPWQREASIAMASGDVATGVRAYHDHGALEAVEGRDAVLARSVAAWSELRVRHGDDALMITRRNRDVDALNGAARTILRAGGRLQGDDVVLPSISREGRITKLSIAVGDRLRFGQSHPALGLRNGTTLILEDIRRDGEGASERVRVMLRTDDGRRIESAWQDLSPAYRGQARPPRIAHAYATTIHGAQGRTVGAAVHVVVVEPDERELYVALTRHTNDVRVIYDVATAALAILKDLSMGPLRDIAQSSRIRTSSKLNIIDYDK